MAIDPSLEKLNTPEVRADYDDGYYDDFYDEEDC